jgi:phosphohistidine phosphatase
MKALYVLRHAKSDWGDDSLDDFDRPLNKRGSKAAEAVGEEMRRRGIAPDLVLASPAVRAQETLQRVQHGYGGKFDATQDRRIYGAMLDTLLDLVRASTDAADRLMIVGHNEGLRDLVVALAQDSELRDEAFHKFPTAALAEIIFDVERWRDVETGTGRLEVLLKPRDL